MTNFTERAPSKETWLPIPGFSGYEASSNGRIRSLLRTEPRILKPTVGRKGYFQVSLAGRRCRKVSVLVCTAFRGTRPKGLHCAHLNGNPGDNRPENLAWVRPKTNARHKRIHGTEPIGSKRRNSKLDEQRVIAIKKELRAGAEQKQIAKREGVSRTCISQISRGVIWSHAGGSLANEFVEPNVVEVSWYAQTDTHELHDKGSVLDDYSEPVLAMVVRKNDYQRLLKLARKGHALKTL